jgi:hypothetical protein
MKKILKWIAIVVGVVAVLGFGAFLYFIPPLDSIPSEEFSSAEAKAAPTVEHISDPAQRMMAERGRYIVVTTGCTGCHTPGGDAGPNWAKYLAGGTKLSAKGYGTVHSRNLTSDEETGIARRTDEDVIRVLRGGVFPDGRMIHGRAMPWTQFSIWTEEDMRAVLVYLRSLKPITNRVPDYSETESLDDKNAAESFYAGDYSVR